MHEVPGRRARDRPPLPPRTVGHPAGKLRGVVRGLYTKPPSEAELAAFGLTRDDLDDADVEILPDNLKAVNAFVAMTTQWRVGASGVTGLDYTSLPLVFRMQRVPFAEQPDTFESIRVMEAEALIIFGEQNG
ncbi:MAG TPA: DUF1799 domain-containing protein [Lysobacter sp.]